MHAIVVRLSRHHMRVLYQDNKVLETQEDCIKLKEVDVSHPKGQLYTSYRSPQSAPPHPDSEASKDTITYDVTLLSDVPNGRCWWDPTNVCRPEPREEMGPGSAS